MHHKTNAHRKLAQFRHFQHQLKNRSRFHKILGPTASFFKLLTISDYSEGFIEDFLQKSVLFMDMLSTDEMIEQEKYPPTNLMTKVPLPNILPFPTFRSSDMTLYSIADINYKFTRNAGTVSVITSIFFNQKVVL
jgi:hypothetical protein